MCQSAREISREEPLKRKVWRVVYPAEHDYVHRCSVCGKFKSQLRMHWFFTGLYCVACIQDILWDNCRTMEEMK